METVSIPVMSVHQNIGELYIGVILAHDLFSIAEVDRVRLESLEVPKYAGYQRALALDRVRAIRDYLTTPRSTFPNAIILSIDSEYIEHWDPGHNGAGTLTVRKDPGAVQIIDGQHRTAALIEAPSDFQVLVTMFVDLRLEHRAEIFAKINSTQKAVNPSIAFQLFGYSEERSPQRTAHDIAETFNTTDGSPFYRRLRMLGTRDDWSVGNLSQATFAKELMKLYTRDPQRDENRLLRGEPLEEYPGYPFRHLFLDRQDGKILETFWRFFVHVAETWKDQWLDDPGHSILTKTTGYAAFVAVLKSWLLSSSAKEVWQDDGAKERLSKIRERHEAKEGRFVRDNFPAGNQGVVKLRDALLAELDLH